MKKTNILKSLVLISALVFTSCTDLLQGKVDMDITTPAGSIESFFTPKEKVTSLACPDQIYVSHGQSRDSIVVNWNEVEHATSYIIERAVVLRNEDGTWPTPDETEFVLENAYTDKTTYTDRIIIDAKEDNEEYNYVYVYRIAAENRRLGLTSDFSDYAKDIAGSTGWLLAPPKNVEAWKGKSTSEIRLTWTKNSDATFYYIYRGKDVENMEKIATVYGNLNYYSNEIPAANQGMEYYYKVESVTSTYITSARSSEALGYALKEGAPTAPDNIQVTGLGVTTDSLVITWDEVTVAGADKITYSLYRNSATDSVFTLIKSGLESRSFTDTTVKVNNLYYYFVQTVAEKGEERIKSPFSDTGAESENPSQGFLLSPPTTLEVADSVNDGFVLIRWKAAVGSNVTPLKYYIAAGSTAEGTFDHIDAAVEGTLDSEGYLTKEYPRYPFYKISTYNDAVDLESAYSTVIAPMPDAPVNVNATKTAKISEKWEPNQNGVYPVKITWDTPGGDLPPDGYNVYRSNRIESGYKKISDDVVKGNSFIDCGENYATVRPATIYYYKVVAVNSLGQGKKSNDPQTDELKNFQDGKLHLRSSWGYGALTHDDWFRQYNKTVMRSQEKLSLMHKSPDTAKLGKETISGDICGSLSYDAHLDGLGAEIVMHYTDYADYYVDEKSENGYFLFINGNTDTTSNMSANGNMRGTVVAQGMYPAEAYYGTLQIKGGGAGGGGYDVTIKDLNGNVILDKKLVDWKVGEEGRK